MKKIKLIAAIVILCSMFEQTAVPVSAIDQELGQPEGTSDTSDIEDELNYLAYYPLQIDTQDHSENGKDGVLYGTGGGFDKGYLSLPGGSSSSTAAYVQLPKGLFDNQDTLTISVWLKNETGAGDYSALYFGTPKNGSYPSQYWLLNPCNAASRMKSVLTNDLNTSAPWSTEYGISPTNSGNGITGPNTATGWAMYTTVITPTSITAYYNSTKYGPVTISRSVSDFGTDLLAYIGKSSYSDKFYQGGVQELSICSGEISQENVTNKYYNELLQIASSELTLDETSTREDITLPSSPFSNVTVSWESNNPDVISNTGVVQRPAADDVEVTLTATLSINGYSTTKTFSITALAYNTARDVQMAKEELNLCSVTAENLNLPDIGKYDTAITWISSDPSIMTDDGNIVKRPAIGEGNYTVKLTAVFTKEDSSAKKEFTIEILEEFYANIISYTTGTNDLAGSLHLAYSINNQNWTPLNSENGILFATIPTDNTNKTLSTGIYFSSPSLFRKANGSFGFLATKSNSSTSLYLYDSEDLITYTGERMIETNSTFGNPLSPTCFYDSMIGAYRVVWTAGGTTYSNTSSDLVNLSLPESYVDSESNIISNLEGISENALIGNVIGVTKKEFEALLNKFSPVVNTGIEEIPGLVVEQGEQEALPSTVAFYYSDGSTADLGVTWDTSNLDIHTPGTYNISGTIHQEKYSNPLIEQRADPHIQFDEETGYYYFTASYPAYNNVNSGYDRIILRRSETISGLSDAKGGLDNEITIWTAPVSGTMAKHVWAPEIHRINGKWYIFFAAGSSDNIWAIRPYVLICDGDDPYTDTWTTVKAATSEDSGYFAHMSLDMTYFEHNGRHYVIWADIIGQSALYMQEIDPDQPWAGKGEVIVLTTPEFAWERDTERVNEGAAILKHGGKIFIAFSASGTGPEYCIGLLSADESADLMDTESWNKLSYPILTSQDVPGEYGPGHNSFTVDENGHSIFVYHARSAECYLSQCDWASSNSLYDPCRHARVKRVHWSSDGTPILKMTYAQEVAEEYQGVSMEVIVKAKSANTYTVTFQAGKGGSIQGENIQKITKGADTSYVEAVADSGYEFKIWSDGVTAARRNVTEVKADITLTAEFNELEETEETEEIKNTDETEDTKGTSNISDTGDSDNTIEKQTEGKDINTSVSSPKTADLSPLECCGIFMVISMAGIIFSKRKLKNIGTRSY